MNQSGIPMVSPGVQMTLAGLMASQYARWEVVTTHDIHRVLSENAVVAIGITAGTSSM